MSFAIKILSGPSDDIVGVKFKLEDGENVVGRAQPPCTIKLDGQKVSKKHCTLKVEQKKLILTDHQSSNGVYVNGKKISSIELHIKDRLVVGEFILEITVGS